MESLLRVLAGSILVIFVIGPICIAIGALVVHMWRRSRNAKAAKEKSGSAPGIRM